MSEQRSAADLRAAYGYWHREALHWRRRSQECLGVDRAHALRRLWDAQGKAREAVEALQARGIWPGPRIGPARLSGTSESGKS